MYTLIAFATQWGSSHGGINSFNSDFLTAFGVGYHQNAQIVCVVTEASPEALSEASRAHVKLLPLPYVPVAKSFDSAIGETGVDLVMKSQIKFDPDRTIWLGHDLITGEAALAAAKTAGGRSAVIHHMSYSDYESVAEDSQSAQTKIHQQTVILEKADLVLAIGPLLRDAATDRLSTSKRVHMLIPGLAEIDPQEAPKTFVAFLSGRLSADAARIKQGHLGVAAFAVAEKRARDDGVPEPMRRQPKLLLRGVDFEDRFSLASSTPHDAETHLKKFAEKYAEAVINLHALPFTEDRQQLYRELSRSSVALMPSWHEGFGLVAWEAIAAGVPLILGENSGVYRFLEEEHPGAEKGYVYSVDVKAQSEFPYFRTEDLEATADALKTIAADPAKARKKASSLRNLLLEENSWVSCCEDVVAAFDWDLQRGSLGDRSSVIVRQVGEASHSSTPPVDVQPELLKVPQKQWRAGAGMADSQLLRAEEALLPFDPGRECNVDELRKWISDATRPLTVRLITGAGGQGKTRLAIHVCQQVRTEGWCAGFLDTNLDLAGLKALWTSLRSLNQPILIVVDYAETRQTALLSLLKLSLQNPIAKPVRVLLLARDSGEWWDTLPSRDADCEALLTGSATSGPFPLAALYRTLEEREAAFVKALAAFANALEVKAPDLTADLSADQFERPLFVQMAALLALYGERPTTSQGLTKALLHHERRYWVRLLEPLNLFDAGRRAEQILALATLAGGFPTAKIAETFWRGSKGTVLTTSEFNALFRSMAALYPGTLGLQALRPDLLGEALVAQALLRPEGDVLLDSVLGSSAPQSVRRHALTVLSRLSNERVDVDEVLIAALLRLFPSCGAEVVAVSIETISRLPELAGLAFEKMSSSMKSQLAGSLVATLPDQSVQLASLTCLVFGYQADKAAEKLSNKPDNVDRMLECASALDRYGVYLERIGNFSKACEIAEASVNLLQRLVSKDRNRFEEDYAVALINYSTSLSRNGHPEEAIHAGEKALKSYERLNGKNALRYERQYAAALGNYAVFLGDLGQCDEALSYSGQALEIHKGLALKNADRFEPSYATSLSNHASKLNDAGKYKEALYYSQQALEIRRRLASKTPDSFDEDYAFSLNNHAYTLTSFGENEKALAHAREALQIHRRLFQRIPKAFAREFLISSGHLRLLNWLCRNSAYEAYDDLEASALLLVLTHEQSFIRLYLEFVRGCTTTDLTVRKDCLSSVVSLWADVTGKYKRMTEPYRLCATAWCNKYEPTGDDGWQADWHRFSAQCDGNIPALIVEVARRLNFQFPEHAT
jgi:glycosyltransferase involved in cell wall biosynthesis